MKTKTHFAFRIDMWDVNGENLVEHLAGVEDYTLALATYRAACERWPGTPSRYATARVIENSRRMRPASGLTRVVAKVGAKRHAHAGWKWGYSQTLFLKYLK